MSYYTKLLFRYGAVLLVAALIYYIGVHSVDWRITLAAILIALLVWRAGVYGLGDVLQGKRGEEAVGRSLAELPSDYEILSDIDLAGRGNIDYVVIGPTGIFAIEAKSENGQITYEDGALRRRGTPLITDFLKQAWAEAYAVRDVIRTQLALDHRVQPVLVFSSRGAKVRFGLRPQGGVYVVGARWVTRVILTRSVEQLDRETIRKIKDVILAGRRK